MNILKWIKSQFWTKEFDEQMRGSQDITTAEIKAIVRKYHEGLAVNRHYKRNSDNRLNKAKS